MTAVTRALSEFVSSLAVAGDQQPAQPVTLIPDEVLERAAVLVADTVGIGIRARHDTDSTASVMQSMRDLGMAQGSGVATTVFGDSQTWTPVAAALINGTLAHSLDFDDTHAEGSIHASAPILPAALAAAEIQGASGADFLAGIIAGYEVQLRLSLALVPRLHYERGFHPTATCGVFGAAAAAARIFGLDANQIENAFGACGSQASGSMQFLANGSWNKRFHVGHAAASGLTSAMLARNGYLGSSEAIEGKAGFLNAYSPEPDVARAAEGLGDIWQTMNLAVKPYPSCRYSHAALDALIDLRNANDIKAAEVTSVEVGVSRTGYRIIGEPEAEKRAPANVVDGQFSMPFCAAVVLREGAMVWDDYQQHLNDAETLSLCRRISTVVHERAEAEFPVNMSGIVRVKTTKGEFESFVAVPKGEPANFVSAQEVKAKFVGLVEPYLGVDQCENLLSSLLSVRTAASLDAITGLMRSANVETEAARSLSA